jgi:hypothetical protein
LTSDDAATNGYDVRQKNYAAANAAFQEKYLKERIMIVPELSHSYDEDKSLIQIIINHS